MKLQPIVYWTDRDELQETMPVEFRTHFGLQVAVIVDRFEIFTETFKSYGTCKDVVVLQTP